MSADDYDSWRETMHLLQSPENARSLMETVAAIGRDSPHFDAAGLEAFLFWLVADLERARRIDDQHRLY